jgi:hypothetical protein
MRPAPPVARLGRTAPPLRGAARTTRLTVADGVLVLHSLGAERTWPGLRQATWVHTAEFSLDHGADPLSLDPAGHLELPEGDGVLRVDVADWLPDPDLLRTFNPFDPLQASGVAAVLSAAGVATHLVRTPRDHNEDSRSLLPSGSSRAVLAVGAALSLLAVALLFLGAGGPHAFRATATMLAALGVLGLALLGHVDDLRRSRLDRPGTWSPDDEARARPDGPRSRAFVERSRIAAVGSELVIVDKADGELWLGTEPDTGARVLVEVQDADRPVRAELRRADGTTLVRLPWADWAAGDGGDGLRAFAVRHGLDVTTDSWRPDRRDELGALSPVRPHYSADALLSDARTALRTDAGGWARPPAFTAAVLAFMAVLLALAPGRVHAAPAVIALTAFVLAAAPASVRALHRRRDARLQAPS